MVGGDFCENDLRCKFKNNFQGNGGHFEISKLQKVVIHLCVKLSVFAVSMATAGILVLVLFVWGTFVTLCVTVTNISSCLWYTQSRTIYTSLETNMLTIHHLGNHHV
jgi:hypothetical protein